VVSFPQVSPPKSCIHLPPPSYVLHAPSTSFFLIWSPEGLYKQTRQNENTCRRYWTKTYAIRFPRSIFVPLLLGCCLEVGSVDTRGYLCNRAKAKNFFLCTNR
jgi:hypothetical protein